MGCAIKKELYATVKIPGGSVRARRDTMQGLKRIGAQDVVADSTAQVVTARIECGRQARGFVCGGNVFEDAGYTPTRCESCLARNK